MNTVDKVIKVAENEVNYYEKSVSAYKKNSKVLNSKKNGAGYDNYTKYGKEMHDIYPIVMDFPAPWCDAFVDWCFYKAYGIATAKSLLGGNFDDYTVASCGMYEKKKALYTSPKVGDQVFFTKNGKTSGCYHTGLVYKVDEYYFYTIEGNTSSAKAVVANGGGVFKKQYSIAKYKGKTLFGRPKYDAQKTLIKSITDIAKEVINGKWGNGADRAKKLQDAGYDATEVQKEVNKLAGSTTTQTLKKGAKVKIKSGAVDLNTKKKYASIVYKNTYTVISASGNNVVFGLNGIATGKCDKKYITLI